MQQRVGERIVNAHVPPAVQGIREVVKRVPQTPRPCSDFDVQQ